MRGVERNGERLGNGVGLERRKEGTGGEIRGGEREIGRVWRGFWGEEG